MTPTTTPTAADELKDEISKEMQREIACGWMFMGFLRAIIQGRCPQWMLGSEFRQLMETGERS